MDFFQRFCVSSGISVDSKHSRLAQEARVRLSRVSPGFLCVKATVVQPACVLWVSLHGKWDVHCGGQDRAGGPDLLCGVLECELKCVECCKQHLCLVTYKKPVLIVSAHCWLFPCKDDTASNSEVNSCKNSPGQSGGGGGGPCFLTKITWTIAANIPTWARWRLGWGVSVYCFRSHDWEWWNL